MDRVKIYAETNTKVEVLYEQNYLNHEGEATTATTPVAMIV